MTPFSKIPRRISPACGVHANGHDDYMDARLHAEEEKLQKRIESRCRPRNLIGRFSIFLRRRRLLKKLRNRFEVPYAMFATENRIAEGNRLYDPLNDYGLGRATIPMSVGSGLLKVVRSWLSNKRRHAEPDGVSDGDKPSN